MSRFLSFCGLVLLAVVLPGECRPQKKAPTGPTECPKRCPNLWEPVCGSDGRTFSNKCQLNLVVGCWGEKIFLKANGKCPECPDDAPYVKCFADPCGTSSCPSNPAATCKANYCGGCKAVWYDGNGAVVDCKKPVAANTAFTANAADKPMMDLPPKRGPVGGPTAPGGIPSPIGDGAPGTPGAGGLKPGEMPEPPKPSKPTGSWLGNGQAPPVPLSSEKSIEISGTLKSGFPSGKLPKGSCLVLSLRDVSLMDVASFQLASTTRSVEDEDIGKGFEFSLTSKKPEEDHLWRRYSISAVINVGWCPSKDEQRWIKKGDYLSTTQYTVRMAKGQDEYKDMMVELECYSCTKGDLVAPPGPPAAAAAAAPPADDLGMGTPPMPKPCELEKLKVKPGLLGAFTPSCKPDGSYEEKQCHGSTGHCWCVDADGKEIQGTRKGPGKGGVVCGGPCAKHAANIKAMPGAYVPQCKDDGSYRNKQCHHSVGDCWCVDPSNGNELPMTRKSVKDGENVSCGGDMSDIEVKLSDKEMVIQGVITPDVMIPTGIPGSSCMRIKFEDVSLMDTSSVVIAELQYPVISDDFSRGVPYLLKSKKPLPNEFWRTFSVAVTINVGWCKAEGSDEWIRSGDWHTATAHLIKLNDEQDSYDIPIKLECYDCKRKSVKAKVTRAIPVDSTRPCADALKNNKPMPGAFVPSCKEDGTYDEKQCDGSTGHCWCVDEDGKEINGTKKAPGEKQTNCASCAFRLKNAKKVPGAFVPSCKDDGSYEQKQCHSSTGSCWCVNEDGKELIGTRKDRGQGEPNCAAQPTCAQQLANTKPSPGIFTPTCKPDGSFEDKQCHGSSGFCWCVDENGKEIDGTKKGPGEGEVKCGTCAMKRANTKAMPGAFIPTCNDDGSYERKQCHASTGHCWCVNEDGKELVGTRKTAAEGEPNCESCAMRRANSKSLPGEFVPKCKADGSYHDKQCHPSTGYCWCVSADGTQITGTEKAPGEGEPTCNSDDPCSQPPLTGKCRGYFVRYHFNKKSNTCEEFVYGGCGANKNNFETVEACQKACGMKKVE